MSVWLKRIGIGVVVILLLLVVGVGILLLTFNPNTYKDRIESLVHHRTARTLTISGDIGLSLFPRIGLSVGQVSLSGLQPDEPFLSVDSARFAVAIWPLLSRRLVVDHVAVSGLKAYVSRDASGHFNFDDLLDRAPSSDDAGAGSGVASVVTAPALATRPLGDELHVDIAGLDIKDGEIRYVDAVSGVSGAISQIEASTGRVTTNQPFEVSFKALLSGSDPVVAARMKAQALLSLKPGELRYEAQKVGVTLEGRLGDLDQARLSLSGNVFWNGQEKRLSAERLDGQLDAEVLGATPVQGLKTRLTAGRLQMGPPGDALMMDGLSLRISGKQPGRGFELAADAPSLQLSEKAAKAQPVMITLKINQKDAIAVSLALDGLSGNVDEWRFQSLKLDGSVAGAGRLTRLQLASPLIWNTGLRQGSLTALKGDLVLRDKNRPDQDYSFPMIGSARLDGRKEQLDLDLSAVIDGAQTSLKTTVDGFEALRTQFALKAERITLDPWLSSSVAEATPPSGAGRADSKASSSETGAPDEPSPAPSPAAPAFDLAFLDGLDITGQVSVDDLRLRNSRITGLKTDVQVQEGILALKNLQAQLYEGTLQGDLQASSDRRFQGRLTLAKVALEPMIRAAIDKQPLSGTLGMSLDLHTSGNTQRTLLTNLGGRVDWKIVDGAVHGIDAQRTLTEVAQSLANVLKGRLDTVASPFDQKARTLFEQLTGRLDISKGQGTVSRLLLASNLLQVTEGKPARVDFPAQALDMTLMVKLPTRLPKALKGRMDPLAGASIPVRVTGPWQDLDYAVSWTEVRNQAVQQVVKTGLADLLEGKDPLDRALLPDPASGEAEPPAEAGAAGRIGNVLKGLFGK